VGSELALGRRVVAILDAVVTRLIRSEPAKVAEWEQLESVTVKGTAVRAQVELVETGSTPSETSRNDVAASLGTVVKAA
jgi:hypothetical protein